MLYQTRLEQGKEELKELVYHEVRLPHEFEIEGVVEKLVPVGTDLLLRMAIEDNSLAMEPTEVYLGCDDCTAYNVLYNVVYERLLGDLTEYSKTELTEFLGTIETEEKDEEV